MIDKQTRRDVLRLAGAGMVVAGLKPTMATAQEKERQQE